MLFIIFNLYFDVSFVLYTFYTVWLSFFNCNIDFFVIADNIINPLDDSIITSFSNFLIPELDAASTFSSCWLILFLWSISNRLHFFILLILFEMTFANFCIDLINFSVQYTLLDGLVFSLVILVYAALESIIGLSYLVYINRICQLNQISTSFN